MRDMTDNEIIKALECCVKTEFISDCAKCEMFAIDCKDILIENALDLINRYKAEIERLSIELTAMRGAAKAYRPEAERLEDEVNRLRDYCDDYGKFVDEPRIKSEAIKEFAEKLKEKATSTFYEERKYVDTEDIDNLVKETTEQANFTKN